MNKTVAVRVFSNTLNTVKQAVLKEHVNRSVREDSESLDNHDYCMSPVGSL